MIYGERTPGAFTAAVAADAVLLEDAVEVPSLQYLVRIGAYLGGDGGSDANQKIRGVVYTDALELVAVGDPITVLDGQAPGWVSLMFAEQVGLPLPAGSYRFGLHGGPTDAAAAVRTGGAGTGRTVFTGVPFADGSPASLSGGSHNTTPASLFLEVIDGVTIPGNVTDDYLATLPFSIAQQVFAASGTIRSTRISARAGWYGTAFDPANGANAILRADGPLADLVGSRLSVSSRSLAGRSVAVYAHAARNFPDELADQDLLLSGRAFLALADPALDELNVTVRVLTS